ncbi:unnamed protein product [Sphagnum compactum]
MDTDTVRSWLAKHKLRAVGTLWASSLLGSFAYNFSQPYMKTSVKLIHARLHAQALTLAALTGCALVDYYDRQNRDKTKQSEKHIQSVCSTNPIREQVLTVDMIP